MGTYAGINIIHIQHSSAAVGPPTAIQPATSRPSRRLEPRCRPRASAMSTSRVTGWGALGRFHGRGYSWCFTAGEGTGGVSAPSYRGRLAHGLAPSSCDATKAARDALHSARRRVGATLWASISKRPPPLAWFSAHPSTALSPSSHTFPLTRFYSPSPAVALALAPTL